MTRDKLLEAGLDVLRMLDEKDLSPDEAIAILDVLRFEVMASMSERELGVLFAHESEGPSQEDIARWEDDGGAPAVTEKLCGSEFRPEFPAATTSAMERRNR